jgi:hypothetical protein
MSWHKSFFVYSVLLSPSLLATCESGAILSSRDRKIYRQKNEENRIFLPGNVYVLTWFSVRPGLRPRRAMYSTVQSKFETLGAPQSLK